MDELVDILNADGHKTGRITSKAEAHRKGLFHPTVHIWFYTADARVLLQQRGAEKETFPQLWDVSVAGHVAAGETILEAALREIEEEIGLNISAGELYAIGVFKSVQEHREDLVDKEFHHSFLCELKVPLSDLRKQESEVEALKLIPLPALAEEVWGLAKPGVYVPHKVDYYKTVIKAISDRLEDAAGERSYLV